MTDKNNVVVVITGTSSGIGEKIAEYLSEQGYRVYGLSRSVNTDKKFTSISVDVTKKEEVDNAVQQIINQEKKIDVLINNAGRGMVGAIEDAQAEEIEALIRLNLIGPHNLIQSVLPLFRNQNSGKIINISSIGSEMGLPFRGYYSASKAALDKMNEALRYEVEGFGVNNTILHLGDINTPIADNRIETKVSSPYKDIFSRVLDSMNEHVKQGKSTDEVAAYIEKLIKKDKFKTHYYFGKPLQKLSIFLKKILPQRYFELLIKKYSNL